MDRAGRETALGHRYLVESRLGAGGSGEVFRARDVRVGRSVALKVFSLEDASPGDVRRYAQEARILAGLSHPGLVALLDVGADVDPELGPVAFLAMELIDGTTLREVIARGPIPAAVSADVGHQLAVALRHAHQAGVVHRDIKPSNVMVTPGDRDPVVSGRTGPTVVLADFGIATSRAGGERTAAASSGTAGYQSPEQALGDPAGSASDVYSLGLVLLECHTGTRAYPGAPLASSLARLLDPVEIPDTLGPRWSHLLTGMTSMDPAARPSMGDVADQLAGMHAPDE